MTQIYLVRHAEAEGNLYRRIHGHYDSLITDLGYRQIAALAHRFESIHVDAVYASDLYRTCATASAIYRPKGLELHRRRDLPELKSSNFNLRSFGERVALNMPIQGTAADIMKLAMVAVRKRLRQELPEARLVLQVHDELIVECPEAQAETAAALLKEEMENVVSLSVPLTADAHWGRNWLEAKG